MVRRIIIGPEAIEYCIEYYPGAERHDLSWRGSMFTIIDHTNMRYILYIDGPDLEYAKMNELNKFWEAYNI